MKNRVSIGTQARALERWEFERGFNEHDGYTFTTQIDDLTIFWSMNNQVGYYTIDGETTMIYDWEELDNLMQQTVIY